MRLPSAIVLWLGLAAAGCGGEDPLTPELLASGAGSEADPVVAVVDGEPIHLGRVRELSEELGMAPGDVLEGMIEMTLLAREAERRGHMGSPGVRDVWKKALVQKILAEQVEARVPEDSVTVDDVKAYYVANYKNKGMLLEDAWREIWARILTERRKAEHDALVRRLKEKTRITIDEENVARFLGAGGG